MELRQLEQVVAVAEEGNFTRAAARCHIVQSALSTSIRSLERELGAALFVRTTRRVGLTEAGRALLPEARRTLAAASAARGAVEEVQSLLRGLLRVGGIQTPGTFDQAAVLARFREQHPQVDIRYTRSVSSALIPELQCGALDVAFASLPDQLPDGLAAKPLVTEPFMLVCRPDHRLAAREAVCIEDLAGEVFVGAPAAAGGIIAALGRVFSPGAEKVPFQVNDFVTILDFAAHGLGVAVLPRSLALSRPELRAIRLADECMTWTLAAVTQAADRSTAAAGALLHLL